MPRVRDKIKIWVVSPIKSDDGEIRNSGYTRLRSFYINCVPANGYINSIKYGEKLSKVYSFSDNKPIDIALNGGDGIYFEKPKVDEKDGLYKKPTLISKPLNSYGKVYKFDAEMR